MFARPFARAARSCVRVSPTYERLHLTSRHWQRPLNSPRARHASFTAAVRAQLVQNPFSTSLALLTIIIGGSSLLAVAYIYKTYIVDGFKRYPEPVAVKLRRALYYTNTDVSPRQALKYYKQALEVAQQCGMDPFSDEVLGIKIQVSMMLEKIQNFPLAIEVLELVKGDCLRCVKEIEERAQGGGGEVEKVLGEGEAVTLVPGQETSQPEAINPDAIPVKQETARGKRTRLLSRLVGISVKLGELYANEYVAEKEAAEEQLVWAVETTLKEKRRRETEGVREGDGDWMSDEEMGASMEALAHNYESKSQHYLASPLFLQALTLCPPQSCHSIVLMNNLASSLAQQHPSPAYSPSSSSSSPPSSSAPYLSTPSPFPSEASTPPSSPPPLLHQSRLWAQKALAAASAIPTSARTRECDEGCVAAAHNLGEIAEMLGEMEEASRRYAEARTLAERIGFEEGVKRAREGEGRVGRLEGGEGGIGGGKGWRAWLGG